MLEKILKKNIFTPELSSSDSKKLKGIILYKILINEINTLIISLNFYSEFKLLSVILVQLAIYYIMFVFHLILKDLL